MCPEQAAGNVARCWSVAGRGMDILADVLASQPGAATGRCRPVESARAGWSGGGHTAPPSTAASIGAYAHQISTECRPFSDDLLHIRRYRAHECSINPDCSNYLEESEMRYQMMIAAGVLALMAFGASAQTAQKRTSTEVINSPFTYEALGATPSLQT